MTIFIQFVISLLGRLVQCEQKGWDRGGGLVIHTPKGENSMAVCGFGFKYPSVGPLHKWSRKQSSLITEPPCCVQVRFIS